MIPIPALTRWPATTRARPKLRHRRFAWPSPSSKAPSTGSKLRDNNKEFAFVRSSGTNLDLDPDFHANMAGAKAAGVIAGPYQRVLPPGEADGRTYTDPTIHARRFFTAT